MSTPFQDALHDFVQRSNEYACAVDERAEVDIAARALVVAGDRLEGEMRRMMREEVTRVVSADAIL